MSQYPRYPPPGYPMQGPPPPVYPGQGPPQMQRPMYGMPGIPYPKKSNVGIFVGVGVLFAVVVVLIIVIASQSSDDSESTIDKLRAACVARGDTWNAANTTCTPTTPLGSTGSGTSGTSGTGSSGSGIVIEQQRIACIGKGDTWNVATSTCTPKSSTGGTGGTTYQPISGYYKIRNYAYGAYLCSYALGTALASLQESGCREGYVKFAINQDPNYATNGRVSIQSTATGHFLIPGDNYSIATSAQLYTSNVGYTWKVIPPTTSTPYYMFQDVNSGVYLGVCNNCYGTGTWSANTRPSYTLGLPDIQWVLLKQDTP